MEVLNQLLGSLTLLGELLLNYVTYGFPFAALHVLVAVMLVRQTWYRKIRVETQALERWAPRASPSPPGQGVAAETTRILDEFVADCDKLGGQGFFIPMTDFSDRLDSIVDGVTSEMHDRTNLFILVGVAGTLLGVFEFAFESQRAIMGNAANPGQSLPELSKALTSSMSKAFPVGFVGLVLTFAAQVIASFPERRLRTALADATGKALEAREEASRSHATALQDSVQAMRETMGESVRSMEGALRPLANLQETLGTFVEPTMNELREHLGKSLELVRAQFDEMQKTNAGTQEIVNSAKQAVAELREVAGSQVEQSRQTREINESTIRDMRQQQATLAVFQDTLTANLERVELLNDTVARAAEGVEALPGRVQAAAQMTFDYLAGDTLAAWRGMSDELKHQVAGEHERLLDDAAAQAKEVYDTLLAASAELGGVAAGVRASVDGLTKLPEHLEAEMRRVFGSVAATSTGYWNQRTDSYMEQMSAHQGRFLDVIREKTEDVERSLRQASDHLTDISRRMDIILGDSLKSAIREAKSELEAGLKHLDRVLVEHYPQLSHNVLTLSESLQEAVARSSEIHHESAQWLQGVRDAYERLADINRVLAEAIARAREETSPTNAEQVRGLLQQNVEELKGLGERLTSVGRSIPAPGQLQGISAQLEGGFRISTKLDDRLRGTAELLARIHEDLRAKEPEPSPPPPNGRFWHRLPWPFRRRGNNGG
jgi:hypothetical protein